jgi:hypothetical protein
MRKALIFLTSAILLPAVAQAETNRSSAGGMDLEYQVTTLADGVRQITGINRTTNERFSLKANRRWVWGKVGGSEVSFRMPRAKSDARATVLASR